MGNKYEMISFLFDYDIIEIFMYTNRMFELKVNFSSLIKQFGI